MNNTTKEQREQESKSEIEVYIDSNLFITSVISLEDEGNQGRQLIGEIKSGKYKAYTSTLTIDEVLWIIQKEKDRDVAYEAAKIIIEVPNLYFIAVNEEIMKNSIEIYKDENLRPRDSIHLACMRFKGLKTILSSDSDFDKIKGIKRINFTKKKK